MDRNFNIVLNCFTPKLKESLLQEITQNETNNLEEIRIRNNLPVILKFGQTKNQNEKIINYKITTEDINYIFQKICENSIYSYQNQIANGYITINGGNRVGLVGTSVLKNGTVNNFNYISSLNFRISRQVIGCSNEIIDKIINFEENTIYNTLIVASPGMGKTTLLRDIVRNISNGIEEKLFGQTVSVIDERGEISAMYKGIPQNDLGIKTDIINDIPKQIGIRMAIRSMAPQVVVADEIGCKEDTEAIKYAMCSGVKGIFTAHGKSVEDVCKNNELKDLIENKYIEKIIVIRNRKYEVIQI